MQEYLGALERDDQVICSTMMWMEIKEWHAGRVVLVGDAAHANSPMMGQCGCVAMEDACVLAEGKRSAATVKDALTSYVRRRKPRVEWVQRQSVGLANLLTASSAARNAMLRERGTHLMRDRFGRSCHLLKCAYSGITPAEASSPNRSRSASARHCAMRVGKVAFGSRAAVPNASAPQPLYAG